MRVLVPSCEGTPTPCDAGGVGRDAACWCGRSRTSGLPQHAGLVGRACTAGPERRRNPGRAWCCGHSLSCHCKPQTYERSPEPQPERGGPAYVRVQGPYPIAGARRTHERIHACESDWTTSPPRMCVLTSSTDQPIGVSVLSSCAARAAAAVGGPGPALRLAQGRPLSRNPNGRSSGAGGVARAGWARAAEGWGRIG